MTPAPFCTISARARASRSTVASVVTSPLPMSSSSARRTSSATPSSGIVAALRRRGEQIGAHEAVEIAVENTLHVADLGAGARVLDHRIGMQHRGADLRAEVHILRLAI